MNRTFTRLLPLILIAAAVCIGSPAIAQAAAPSATLSWGPPTQYVDGTTIPSGTTITYNVYQGRTATTLGTTPAATGVTAVTDTIATGLMDGVTYCWAVTAVVNGLESAQTPAVCKTFPPAAPGSVINLKVTQAPRRSKTG